MKTITLKIDTDNPIICPVVIGYRNLTSAQQELVDEQGVCEEDFPCPSSEPFWFWNDTVYSVYIDCYENFLPFGTRLHMTVGGVEYFLEFSEGVVKLIPFTISEQ